MSINSALNVDSVSPVVTVTIGVVVPLIVKIMNKNLDYDELFCNKHKISLDCMGGRSAHWSNWYCPKCEELDARDAARTTTATN